MENQVTKKQETILPVTRKRTYKHEKTTRTQQNMKPGSNHDENREEMEEKEIIRILDDNLANGA